MMHRREDRETGMWFSYQGRAGWEKWEKWEMGGYMEGYALCMK